MRPLTPTRKYKDVKTPEKKNPNFILNTPEVRNKEEEFDDRFNVVAPDTPLWEKCRQQMRVKQDMIDKKKAAAAGDQQALEDLNWMELQALGNGEDDWDEADDLDSEVFDPDAEE